MKLEVSSPSNLGKPVPLAPPMNTAGLTGIKLELTTPIVAKEVCLHFHRPVVTDSVSLSNLLLLGTIYGSDNSLKDKEKEKLKPTIKTGDHPRYMYIATGLYGQYLIACRTLYIILNG